MKDPAFLFYPADASEDTQFMNRLERGCYFDILKAQKRFEKFTLEQLKKVLGSDFEICWPALQLVLKCEEGFYYIEWVAEKIIERKKFSESRRKNRTKKEDTPTSDEQVLNISSTSDEHMVIENENEDYKEECIENYKKPGDAILFTIEHCITVALNDERWVKANKTSKKELEEFNRLLEKRAEYQKNPADYKNHFANWKGKGKIDFTKNESPPSGPSPSELRALEILKQVG